MGRKDDLDRMKRGEEFQAYALRQGCEERHGRHPYYTAPNGHGCPIPNGELPTGTRKSIKKMFVAMGIALLIAALVVLPMVIT